MDIESFFPSKDRFQLAMTLNNLLAAPGFSAWMSGEPMDVDRLLYTSDGKPRVSIFSIAHLSESERMFFVSLLLNQTLGWMRTRPGTTSLRALLYIDEIFGYMPPVAEPPSKKPLLTLLKQARAFGLGLVLATQNPADLDYKGLSNTGTWFLGRLQTERDKDRVLDGLEGSIERGGRKFRPRDDVRDSLGRGKTRVPDAQRPRRSPGRVSHAMGVVVPFRTDDPRPDQATDGGSQTDRLRPSRTPATIRFEVG